MMQTANPTAMSRDHDVSGFFGNVSQAKVHRAARAEERKTGGAAMITLIESGLFFNRERAVRASEVSSAELNAANAVSLSVEKTGLGRLLSYDPVLAEGSVDQGVARVNDKQRKAAAEQTRVPEIRDEFDTSSLSSMMIAVQERAANTNGLEVDSQEVEIIPIGSPSRSKNRERTHGSAAEVFAQSDTWNTLTVLPSFEIAAADNDNGGVEFMGSRGIVGFGILVPIADVNGLGRRTSALRNKLRGLEDAARSSYEAPKGWDLEAA